MEQGFSVPWLNREYLLQAVRGGEEGGREDKVYHSRVGSLLRKKIADRQGGE